MQIMVSKDVQESHEFLSENTSVAMLRNLNHKRD